MDRVEDLFTLQWSQEEIKIPARSFQWISANRWRKWFIIPSTLLHQNSGLAQPLYAEILPNIGGYREISSVSSTTPRIRPTLPSRAGCSRQTSRILPISSPLDGAVESPEMILSIVLYTESWRIRLSGSR